MKKLIPFHWLPGSWGLKGKIYREAEAHYYYSGKELDYKLAEIQFEDNPIGLNKKNLELSVKWGAISDYEYKKSLILLDHDVDSIEAKKALIDLDLKFRNIDEYVASQKLIELEYTDKERDLKLLELDYAHHKIERNEFEKKSATLNDKPWVGIKDDWMDINEGLNGFYMELDWNELWIKYLRMNGYTGLTEEEIVSKWFSDVMGNEEYTETDSNENQMGRRPRTTNLRQDKDGSYYS